jgi:CRP-like cAMP-binding protein
VVTALPQLSCRSCPLGQASITGSTACPFHDGARPARSLIYLEGEAAQRIWYVREGVVVLSRESGLSYGEGLASAVRSAGNLVGSEALSGPNYVHSARAATPVRLCGASKARVEAWLDAAPRAARTLLELVLATQARDAALQIGGSATSRVARWLLDEALSPKLMPRRLVAELLGMQPETMSRSLGAIASRGAIRLERHDIEILDRALLEDIATRG